MMDDITPEELKTRLSSGEKINLFDVREEWEYNEYDIGAKLLPLPSIHRELETLSPLKDQEIIVHCKSGIRSNQAKKFLIKKGFENVRCLVGGIDAFLKTQ